MTTLLALAAIVVAGLIFGLVAGQARAGRISHRSLLALSALCGAGLVAMTISDWPEQSLSRFWANHSVVSAVLSTLLLLGSGFLAFEARDTVRQNQLNESLAAAAFGGTVDHVLDIDIALALAVQERHEHYESDGKPLRWVRLIRDGLEDAVDPRAFAINPLPVDAAPWRRDMVDQCVRRLMSAMKEWGPVLGLTNDGRQVLVRFGELRNELLELQADLTRQRHEAAATRLVTIRAECQVLALGLEVGSGVQETRPGVLHQLSSGLGSGAASHAMNKISECISNCGPQAGDRAGALAQIRRLPGMPVQSAKPGLGSRIRAVVGHQE